jgi:hypothetical protein
VSTSVLKGKAYYRGPVRVNVGHEGPVFWEHEDSLGRVQAGRLEASGTRRFERGVHLFAHRAEITVTQE